MRRALLLPTAIALAAFAGGNQGVPPEPVKPDLLLRIAFMMGSRGDAPLPVGTHAPIDTQAFGGWDPTADNPELKQLLGLRQLVELSRGAMTIPADQHSISVSLFAGKRLYELVVDAADMRAGVVFLAITLKEDGTQVAQPRLGLTLGQKGVACARVSRGRDEAFVFFVLQLDDLASLPGDRDGPEREREEP